MQLQEDIDFHDVSGTPAARAYVDDVSLMRVAVGEGAIAGRSAIEYVRNTCRAAK